MMGRAGQKEKRQISAQQNPAERAPAGSSGSPRSGRYLLPELDDARHSRIAIQRAACL
ncbi:hypothetical protein CBM2634_U310004 [Cupriavidus taiwanensis]|uniref:Uncharacterized protein n=1 Tax=Cupriavidus taiwanensis TaxID=164546 RepID=A0A375JGP3_9BURK|nr:hypothetical protein CBM2634_U310004 [Cupriavidus taiwanensis]